MSAANRSGNVRQKDDFYSTPSWCTEAIISHLGSFKSVLDPCAGKGAILDVCKNVETHGIEINQHRQSICESKDHKVVLADALKLDSWPIADIIITNPPYSLAQHFVERSLKNFKGKTCAFLLRLGFLESEERAEFHRLQPCDFYILVKRPQFCQTIQCKLTKGGCGWHQLLATDQPTTKRCPNCGRGGLSVSKQDATVYAWFVWGNGRGGKWFLL